MKGHTPSLSETSLVTGLRRQEGYALHPWGTEEERPATAGLLCSSVDPGSGAVGSAAGAGWECHLVQGDLECPKEGLETWGHQEIPGIKAGQEGTQKD